MTFNYRGNPLVQQARAMIATARSAARTSSTATTCRTGCCRTTDYSWRLEPEKGGASSAIGDIGSHWCDLAQHVVGQRIVEVLADLTTVIRRAMQAGRLDAKRSRRSEGAAREPFTVDAARISRRVLVRFDGGAKDAFSVGQVCAGHKNDLWFEAERPQGVAALGTRSARTSCGSDGATGRTACSLKDPSLVDAAAPLRAPAGRSPGSVGGRVLQRDARHLRVHRRRASA